MNNMKRYFRHFSPSFLRLLAVVLIVAGASLLVYSEAIEPALIAHSYRTQNDLAVDSPNDRFDAIVNTTNLPIFETPDTPAAVSLDNLKTIKTQIASTNIVLTNFVSTANSLPTIHGRGFSGGYQNAKVERQQSLLIAAQARDVLNRYQQAADFLTVYYGIAQIFEQKTAATNNVSDLSGLQADIPSLQATASQFQSLADKLQATPCPDDYQAVKVAFVPLLRQTANGYHQLAQGLSLFSDSQVSVGITIIEQVSDAYDPGIRNQVFTASQRSPILQNASQLSSKTDILTSDNQGD